MRFRQCILWNQIRLLKIISVTRRTVAEIKVFSGRLHQILAVGINTFTYNRKLIGVVRLGIVPRYSLPGQYHPYNFFGVSTITIIIANIRISVEGVHRVSVYDARSIIVG